MASLTIRNLTITPLTLLTVERFEAGKPPGPTANPIANITSSVTSSIKGFLNPITVAPTPGLVAKSDDPHDRHDDVDIRLDPFTTQQTSIRAADPGREVLRLTFSEPGGPAGRYTVDVPGPSARSLTLNRHDGADKEITAIYLGTGAFLALLSSANLSRWMSELDDALPLSCLSLPGTHNSPTCHVSLPSVRCQAVAVRAQLDNGVRFLDVRVSANPPGESDDLTLVHSAFPVSLTGARRLDAHLLADVYAFLDANPGETVVVSLKREGTGKASDPQLGRLLRESARYLGGEAGRRRWFTEARIPRLGEARGRCVLVRRFAVDDDLRGWGIDGSSWPDNCADAPTGGGEMRVQDFYEVTESTNIERKIDLARAHLERAAEQLFPLPGRVGVQEEERGQGQNPPPFFVNFLSASNFFNATCWPERIAAKINPAMVEYLCMRHGEGGKGPAGLQVGDACTGVVVTDWVGHGGDWDLLRCIVGWNARLQLKR